MLRIGLTGGIGSGKSTVAKVFETLGVPVYYSDIAARRLQQEDATIRKSIRHLFGPEAYLNGLLNRTYIASIVFSNPDKLKALNALVHPATIADASKWMQQQTARYAIKEAALIFESDAHKELDKVIGISAPLPLRIARAMQRDHVSQEEVLARMNRQMDEEEKMSRCDYILVNDEIHPLLSQILDLHQQLLQESR